MSVLSEAIAAIGRPDPEAARAAAVHLDDLTKPLGALGHLEELVRRYAAIRHDPSAAFDHAAIAVFVADHGIADESVSAYPKAVTAQMLRNLAGGGAAINVLCRHFGYSLTVVDIGVEPDLSGERLSGVLHRRVGPGSRNFARSAAMSNAQAREALEVGIEVAGQLAAEKATLIGIGEMGIGNSSSAAALLCALTGASAALIAGRGTGLDEAGWRRKVETIDRAVALHAGAQSSPLELLAALGGFDIAAMAGVCIGGAGMHIPVVVDGFIATAAAAIADRIAPGLLPNLFFAHRSAEGGHRLVLDHLGVRPVLDLDLRLGEGTGAALAIASIRAALALFHEMATFSGAGVAEKLRP